MTEGAAADWRVHLQGIMSSVGITVKDAARRTGISESAIRNWINGYPNVLPDLRGN